ncbi:hypothetical protein BGZ75_005448 [Mortierella antarctica]|nr:hypothetical protein BGZ67_008844 [Mortierella alpina]KAF9983096.1 hypothetical protein BGZ75_005448 [Mortierella antarctica]
MQFKATILLGLVFAVAAVGAQVPTEEARPEMCTPIGANRYCCVFVGQVGCSEMRKRDLVEEEINPQTCTPIGANRQCCWVGGSLGCHEI